MFKTIKEFFVGKPAPVVDVVAPGGAPYKVPEPAATTPIPLVVEPVVAEVAAVTVETVASFSTVVSEGTAPVAEAAPEAKPKRAAKPKAAAKPAAKPATKPAAPKLTVVKTTKAKLKKT
jgi:hypothetical protein